MDEGSDKTKIKRTSKLEKSSKVNSETNSDTDVDRAHQGPEVDTRLNQASKKKANNTEIEDKTRVSPASRYAESTDDATRVVSAGVVRQQQTVDGTRFKPKQAKAADKTQIKPAKKIEEFPTDLESSPEDAAIALHGVLKNRFVLEKVLGAGGMGVVYKARDLLKVEAQDRDPYVAIKVLNEEFKSHPEAFISLQRESRKTQRIAHPNIVNVFDFDRDKDIVFMTMEYLDGEPLDVLINQYHSTGLPTDDAWQIIKGMTSALSHAHAEHIIHSDFKPGNVFVTQKGVAKVFDFGIARAVAQVEQLEDNEDDLTVFDAGNLGALTPAYASLEMLEGEEPDVRDDIYALGCVAYEMLTGHHPYNKVPADEAERQGVKPKRIRHIKKYQWRAIEKAIAFRREDRIESVNQFVTEISPKLNATNPWITGLAFLFLVTGAGYYFFIQQQKSESQFSEFDFRNELELKVRIDFYRENILSQIKSADFSSRWQDSISKDLTDLIQLTASDDAWVEQHKQIIFALYLQKINSLIESELFSQARKLIQNAGRYSGNKDELSRLNNDITVALERQKIKQKMAAAQQQKEKQEQISRRLEKERLKQQETKKITEQKKRKEQFDVALENVYGQLNCQGSINMRNFETAIEKLKQLDMNRYAEQERKIIRSLQACIISIGKVFPERALQAQKQSLPIFKANSLLAAIKIKSRDPCDISIAGLGARGKRTICKDKLKIIETGPELVVIPGNNKMDAFAIGKYEVSIEEMNLFCKQTSSCQTSSNKTTELPVSNINLDIARAYLDWLSSQSEYKYRLPTKKEWLYAARSRRKSLDPNRNCELSTRGFEKGGELVKARIGRQNSWGLVNYVGNVQEWVYDSGRKLVAVGGSYRQAMESCDINTTNAHDGTADSITGLRVLRELRRN